MDGLEKAQVKGVEAGSRGLTRLVLDGLASTTPSQSLTHSSDCTAFDADVVRSSVWPSGTSRIKMLRKRRRASELLFLTVKPTPLDRRLSSVGRLCNPSAIAEYGALTKH